MRETQKRVFSSRLCVNVCVICVCVASWVAVCVCVFMCVCEGGVLLRDIFNSVCQLPSSPSARDVGGKLKNTSNATII